MREGERAAKHAVLRSVAHNIASSLGSGIGLLVGAYDFDIFADAARSTAGYISIDFLSGTTSGGEPSKKVADAIGLYRDAFPEFCRKHDVSVSDFDVFIARYSVSPIARTFLVTIRDRMNRQSSTEYSAPDGQRVKVLDGEGRIRPKSVQRSG